MFPSFRSYNNQQAQRPVHSYGNGTYPSQKYQAQSQSYMRRNKKKQKEKVAFAQQFQDQTDAVFTHLSNVLKMLGQVATFGEDVVNMTTDMLIDSINLFAKNCHYCRENKNFDALQL